MEQDTKAAIK